MKTWKRYVIGGLSLVAVASLGIAGGIYYQSQINSKSNNTSSADSQLAATRVAESDRHYIFELNEDVTREHVYYTNRYGVEIAADLYYPEDMDQSQEYPAIVVGPPFGGVKEQSPGVYANELAQRGFVVVAYDPAYHGYSGGQPRYSGSPDTYVEDFSAAIDYLGTLDYVNRDQIGALGICASGAFALGAAAQDTRISAVATSVLYNIPDLAGSVTGDEWVQQLDAIGEQRWEDYENGTAAYNQNYPSEPQETLDTSDMDDVTAEFNEFYATSRGWHENALANITVASNASFMNFQVTNHINEIQSPILMVTSKEAHSYNFTTDLYAQITPGKAELYVADKGCHIDFYDNTDNVIPFDEFERFFKENLGVTEG